VGARERRRGFENPLAGSVLVFGSLAGAVAGLTLLFLGMRGVMEIGGSCADGGPYVSAHPCPDGTAPAVFGGVWGGVIFLGIYAWLTLTRGIPGFLPLAWPALFLSLGYNFLEYGVDPPAEAPAGLDLGFLVCAIVFGVMGGAPLLIFLVPIVRSLLPFGHPPPARRPAPATRAGATVTAALPGVRLPRSASTGPVAPARTRATVVPAVPDEPGEPVPWPPPARPNADPAAIFDNPVPADGPGIPPGPAAASWASFEPPPIAEDEPSVPPPPTLARDPRLELHPTFPPGSPLAMADAVEAAAAAGTAYGGDTIVTALERLAALHESGALSDAEFAAAKDRLLLGEDAP